MVGLHAAGVGVRRFFFLAACAMAAIAMAAIAMPAIASAQTTVVDQVDEPEVLISVDAGYNTALRLKHWTSVDVVVSNETEDKSGFVEVRTYGFNKALESPTHRMPGEFPRNSRKRFRFNVYMDTPERVEAWVYDERGRPLIDVPAYIKLQPIEEHDLLVAILDEQPEGFGFLYRAVQDEEDLTTRLHRFTLTPPDFGLLPNHVEAYRAFDAVIIGAIDPDRVPNEQRELLRRYAEDGGNVIICTGARGPAYRESWIEELAGIEIGGVVETNDRAIAEAAFPLDAHRAGARENRETVLAELRENDPRISRLGEEMVLATLRPVGRGRVFTLGVDVGGGALANCAGYNVLWREAIRRDDRNELDVGAATTMAAQQLPYLAGVRIRSLGFVLKYLGLYIGIGIVANWIFWSRLKRREYAWVTLVICSFLFTGFAIFSGSAGWDRAAQVHQIEIVEVPKGGGLARYHGITGLFTTRTSTFEGEISIEDAVVYDGSRMHSRQMGGGFGMPQLIQPFQLVHGDQQRVERFRVGASELRVVRVRADWNLGEAIEADFTYEDNTLEGVVKISEEIEPSYVGLIMNNALIKLVQQDERTWTVRSSAEEIKTLRYGAQHYIANGIFGNPNTQEESLRVGIVTGLFNDQNRPWGFDRAQSPVLLIWTDGSPDLAFRPDGEIETQTSIRLIVAGVEVKYARNSDRLRVDFPVNAGNYFAMDERPIATQIREMGPSYQVPDRWDLTIDPGQPWLDDPAGTLTIRIVGLVDRSADYPDGFDVMLAGPGETTRQWHNEHIVETNVHEIGERKAIEYVYKVDDWRDTKGVYSAGMLLFSVLALAKDETELSVNSAGELDMPGTLIIRRPYATVAVGASGEFRPGYQPEETTLPWR